MTEHEDSFTHSNKIYDLSKVRKLLRDKHSFLLPISDLLWIREFDTPSEERITKAKLRYPLLVAKWNGRWVVVDGLHRLELYRRKGITKIPVKEVTDDILKDSYLREQK